MQRPLHGSSRASSRPALLLANDRTTRTDNTGRGVTYVNQAVAAVKSSLRSDPKTQPTNANGTRKKVDDILKRMLPHTIVQTYDKIDTILKPRVVVTVNGEPLAVVEQVDTPVSAKWTALQQQSMATKSHVVARTQPFHYARSIQYTSSQPELSLDTLRFLDVKVDSEGTTHSTPFVNQPTQQLTRKFWKRIAETDPKIGLALYEYACGPWMASSVVVLVWAKTLEVVNIYLQLNLAEVLYNSPARPLRILPDDVDTTYGLHSYTVAVTIRDFHRVHWEAELFSVEFPPLEGVQDTISVNLLDDQNGYRDSSRFLSTTPTIAVQTDAISTSLASALVIDCTLWEASCNPVWSWSKVVPVCVREAPRTAGDMSMSVVGQSRELLEMIYSDPSRGNSACISLEQPGTTAKSRRVFVKQIVLSLSVSFINATFGTSYATRTNKMKK